jgi:hypothetical protein
MTSTTRCFLSAVATAALVLAASTPAQAISISITSIVDNTGVTLTGGGSGDRAQAHSVSATNPGTFVADALNATVNAASRYIGNVAADRGSAFSGGTANATLNVNYTVNFQITPDNLDAFHTYTVAIGTNMLGAATQLDDASGVSNGGTATITNVSGFLGVNPNAGLNLASAASQGGTSSTSGAATQFSANNLLNLGPFSGVQNLSVRFTWAMTATSPQAVNGGDETSVRLGASGPLGGASADSYPGVGNRTQANDGHFVNIAATMVTVPEPSTFILAGMAGVGIVLAARRRARRS